MRNTSEPAVGATLVLGVGGMLGSTLFRSLLKAGLPTVGTLRNSAALGYFCEAERAMIRTGIDATDESVLRLLDDVRPAVVVNCIGVVKQLAAAKDPLLTIPINALFPHRLAALCRLVGARLVQLSTDCVFSGSKGGYVESDIPDPVDLYGRSKLLGEILDRDDVLTLRTSMIGRELATATGLVEWFLSQSGPVRGFERAIFSGLPTDELSALIIEYAVRRWSLSGLYHVSAAPISKLELLGLVAAEYGKSVDIVPDATLVQDRSLDSSRFTTATAYRAPAWPDLIRNMHQSDVRNA